MESIRKWWYAEGKAEYEYADKIVLTADCGGNNGNRNRLWKFELQKLANEIGKYIQVLHYPSGMSKWNKIEHSMFAFISKNWQGVSLESTSVIVNIIGSTKTVKELSSRCILDEKVYERGLEVTDAEFDSIYILNDDFHGDWNYTICRNMEKFISLFLDNSLLQMFFKLQAGLSTFCGALDGFITTIDFDRRLNKFPDN